MIWHITITWGAVLACLVVLCKLLREAGWEEPDFVTYTEGLLTLIFPVLLLIAVLSSVWGWGL